MRRFVSHSSTPARSSPALTRRELLRDALICTTLSPALHSIANAPVASDADPIARTAYGRVRGTAVPGLNIFKGIPYGASTEGERRFLPPESPESWSGVRDALGYGPLAPQSLTEVQYQRSTVQNANLRELESLFAGSSRSRTPRMSEACLTLNLWVPSDMDPNLKRPVMVWLHGGGFSGGSSDAPWTDGTNLARQYGTIVVSLNHRLNIFGHFYLGDVAGPKYSESGNVGLLDIVAALRWIHDNIRAFGGDRDNVTIFGQSGGGGKVIALMGMPAAKGLFHKTISQSGPYLRGIAREDAARTTDHVLRHLGLQNNELEALQQIPPSRLMAAMNAVLDPTALPEWLADWVTWSAVFAPVVGDTALPNDPFFPSAPDLSADIPMIVGTTGTELSSFDQSFGDSELYHRVALLGFDDAQGHRLVAAYRSAHARASACDIFHDIASDRLCRAFVIKQADLKALQGRAPVYMYLFSYNPPAFGGKYKSIHGIDLPFVFDNLDKAPGFWGTSPLAQHQALAEKVSGAWAAFAKTGNPGHVGQAKWEPYSLHRRATMVFDRQCQLSHHVREPDRLNIERFFMRDCERRPSISST